MATYKTANNLPIMEEVSENTYALVEENGALKRVSGDNLGGKGNRCVFTVTDESSQINPVGAAVYSYACNMSYSDFRRVAWEEQTVTGIDLVMRSSYGFRLGHGYEVYGDNSDGTLEICFYIGQESYTLVYYPNGTIEEMQQEVS